jgi:hypothetical protein
VTAREIGRVTIAEALELTARPAHLPVYGLSAGPVCRNDAWASNPRLKEMGRNGSSKSRLEHVGSGPMPSRWRGRAA